MDKMAIFAKANEIINSPMPTGEPTVQTPTVAEVVVIGILLVFFILVLITVIMMLFPYIFNTKSKKEKVEPIIQDFPQTEQATNDIVQDDGELISVITAAIAAYRSSQGESSATSSFRVVTFKKAQHR